MIDLRSDTVTRPTEAMRAAIAAAEVGDDQYGEDPSVIALQERVAALLGKEAALLVPTGTMANQLALKLFCRPGDDVIVGAESHAVWHETGAAAAIGGIQFTEVGTDGRFTADAFLAARNPRDHLLYPPTTLVEVEDTQNRKGGLVWDRAELERIGAAAREHGVASYLDGARLLNAAAARGDDPAALAAPFDLVSLALSKGLGCPVGSVLAGTRDDVAALVRYRRMLGGAMRQAGVLAAAGLHALDHHVDRLARGPRERARDRRAARRARRRRPRARRARDEHHRLPPARRRPGRAGRRRPRRRARRAGHGLRPAHDPRGHPSGRVARGLRDGGGGARGGDRVSEPIYFASAAEFGAWLAEHHATATEVWIGYWKKHTGKPSLVWSDAVDEALCFGWIDGVLRRVDDERHMQRFTPRKPTSNWSAVNVAKVAALREAGRMRLGRRGGVRAPAGGPHRRLLVRAARRPAARARAACPVRGRAGGVGVLPGPAALLPAAGELVGDQREEAGDARPPPGAADLRQRLRRADQAAQAAEAEGLTAPGGV